jgi:hypothetical protein
MKTKSVRIGIVAAAALMALVAFAPSASAQVNIGVQVGGPPPGPRVEHRWGRPYPGAVWIPGYQDWQGGRWVWVGGYWGYPPRRGGVWVPGHYGHGYWRPGHWR